MEVKIGPAGLGPVKTAIAVLEDYHKKGFRACEIAFTYSIYIKDRKDAEKIGRKAKELGIELSIHAPYWVNLNSQEKAKREATKKRILGCCEVGHWLGAKSIVFHPGYYGNKAPKSPFGEKQNQALDYGNNREEAYENIRDGIKEIMAEVKKNKWNVELCPETMGKVNVFGSAEEISRLVKDTKCGFCIDFAHILAREKEVDYNKLERLFPAKKWHCHFSGIVYGEKGEKHHKKTEKKEWKELLKNLPKSKEIIVINESPDMINDCLEALKIMQNL